MTEIELAGGRITPGVVRIGDTVRRPRSERSGWINQLLTSLEDASYQHAPRFRGIDHQGRDILTYVPGTTTDHPSQRHPDAYRRGGQMLRQLHDLTTGHRLINDWPTRTNETGNARCIVHGDPGVYNTIFQHGLPVALIDWDTAHPGNPVDDLAYLSWTWCIQSAGNVPIADQTAHLRDLAGGYGLDSLQLSVDDLLDHVIRVQQDLIDAETRVLTRRTTTPSRGTHAQTAIAWATADREMLLRHHTEFTESLVQP